MEKESGEPEKEFLDPKTVLEKRISILRGLGKEKWIEVYPLNREEYDNTDNLTWRITQAAGIEAINYKKLEKSNIVGDYRIEIQFDKPKDFDAAEFYKRFDILTKNIEFMYGSSIKKIFGESVDDKVMIGIYLEMEWKLRLLNVNSYLLKRKIII